MVVFRKLFRSFQFFNILMLANNDIAKTIEAQISITDFNFNKVLIAIVCSYHVKYAFQRESTLYSCVNVKELLAWNRCNIYSLSDCNGTRTHNHLVRKRPLTHLVKLAKWLSCVSSTYMYSAFDCIFSSCHVHVLESIYTLERMFQDSSGCGFELRCSQFKLIFDKTSEIFSFKIVKNW